MCDMVGQYIQKKEEEKQIEEEQVAKTQYWKIPICYDDDDDDDYAIAITHKELDNSLSMGDEHFDTVPATKSNEFIKYSVENLVPNPSESKGEHECDVPACEVFTTLSNILFDADYDFSSSDDQSYSDEDIPKKIYSNPLFDEEIISMKINPRHFNAESDLIKSLLNHDSSIISSSSKIDSLFDKFADELTLLKSILPGINETDCDPEEETHFIKRLLYDNLYPRPPKEFISENSDAAFESFFLSHISVEDSDSLMEEINLSFTSDDPMPPGIEEDDYDSERDILILQNCLAMIPFHFLKMSHFILILLHPLVLLQNHRMYSQKFKDSYRRILSSSLHFLNFVRESCALLRKIFREDLFTYCIGNGILQDSSEPSNDNTNVVNALQEPFVVNQDPGKNSSQSLPQINHHCCYGCGDPLEDIFCHQCTCELCGKGAHFGYNCPPKVSIILNPEPFNNQTVNEFPPTVPSFDSTCYSEEGNSLTYDSTSNLVHDSPNVFNPHSQPPLYSCEFYGNDARFGHYFTPQVSFIYPKPCYNKDFNFPQKFYDFQQQYLCCENYGVPHEAYQCQPMNEDYYHEQNSCYDPNSFGFDQFQPPQYTKKEEKQIKEEQAAKTRYWKIPICYDDDDDDYAIAITHKEPDNSLSMGDEHFDTVSATESDEFIKSSVENLVPNPSESEGEHECDVPACEVFTTFSNILFDADYDFSSSDDQSFFDEDIPKEIYSNPLFDEEIISMKINPHHFNAESDLIESLLNYDSSIISSSSKIDSLFDKFADELTLLKSIPPGINETDCDPEEETRFIKRLLYDNSSSRPPKEFISKNSDAAFESFFPSPIPVEDSDSLIEETDLSFTPDNPMPPGIEEDDYDSERDILILKELFGNDILSLPENESFYFDIPSSPRPPAKPPDGITGILNVKVMGDISEHKTHTEGFCPLVFISSSLHFLIFIRESFPHPYTRNYMPPKPDLVFADEHVVSESVTSLPDIAKSKVKTSETKLKNVSALVKDNKEKHKIRAKTGQNQEQTGSVKKSKVKPDKVKAQSKPKSIK
nr:hypothetical protein [Tanacetum cinerariifolium]